MNVLNLAQRCKDMNIGLSENYYQRFDLVLL